MRKYIALVLLLSFVGLLWPQEDTCLQTDNEAVDVEEGASDEQVGDIQHPNLLQLTSKPSFIYTQEYFTSEQDTTEIIGSDGFKLHNFCCCTGVILGLLAIVYLLIILDEISDSFPGGGG